MLDLKLIPVNQPTPFASSTPYNRNPLLPTCSSNLGTRSSPLQVEVTRKRVYLSLLPKPRLWVAIGR